MPEKIILITKWLKDSGLKVNENKTELCLFYRKDTPQIEIAINNVMIKSMKSMNVLGVEFDSKLGPFMLQSKSTKQKVRYMPST